MLQAQGEFFDDTLFHFAVTNVPLSSCSIRPCSTIPICLDLGTNTQKFLDDPLYLGVRQKRLSTEVMTEFMEEFMHEMTTAFPKLLIQFEDFSTDHAFLYLEKFRNLPVFNDDVRPYFHSKGSIY